MLSFTFESLYMDFAFKLVRNFYEECFLKTTEVQICKKKKTQKNSCSNTGNIYFILEKNGIFKQFLAVIHFFGGVVSH